MFHNFIINIINKHKQTQFITLQCSRVVYEVCRYLNFHSHYRTPTLNRLREKCHSPEFPNSTFSFPDSMGGDTNSDSDRTDLTYPRSEWTTLIFSSGY